MHFATRMMMIKVRDREARCDFEDIPPGRYALAVIHDENMNGKLDANWLGVPKEGYGFSNDAKGLTAGREIGIDEGTEIFVGTFACDP